MEPFPLVCVGRELQNFGAQPQSCFAKFAASLTRAGRVRDSPEKACPVELLPVCLPAFSHGVGGEWKSLGAARQKVVAARGGEGGEVYGKRWARPRRLQCPVGFPKQRGLLLTDSLASFPRPCIPHLTEGVIRGHAGLG